MLSSFDPESSSFVADPFMGSTAPVSSSANLGSFSGSTTSLNSASPGNAAHSIAFVDSGLSDIETLTAGLENTQVVLLDSAQNGLAQITATLQNYEELNSIHIFSHGTDGLLQLGDTLLSNANIEGYGESLQQWATALSAEADLMIYGCNLAAGPQGLSLIHRLSELTGADVAASDDVTGAGGDWQLEASTGEIETSVAVSDAAQTRYEGKLAAAGELLVNGGFESGFNGWDRFYSGESVATTGARVGDKVLKLTKDLGGTQQIIDAVAGQTYKVSGYGKKTGSAYIGFGITFYDAANKKIANSTANTPITSSNWRRYESEIVAPDNARTVRFWTYHDRNEGIGLIDQLSLTTSETDLTAADDELLVNGGFESNFGGWDRFYDSESVETGGARVGTKSLKLTRDRGGTQQIIDAVAGQTYKMSGYGKKTGPAYIGFGITFYDAADRKIANSTANNPITGSNWRLYESEAVAPNNARSVRFWTYHDYGNGTGFLDQLSLTTDNEVIDVEPSLVSLDDSTLEVDEGDRTISVVVNRAGGTQGELTVDYRTVAGTATAGEDYEAVSGTLTFADGQARQTVDINILDDNTPEGQESFSFAIDNVGGNGTLGAPRTAGIEIADNDTFSYRGNQYVATNGAKTWRQAQAEAERLGGNLVTINTAQEENWLRQNFGRTEGFWIGLNDADTEGTFEWASGERVGYTNWAPDEPNDGEFIESQDYGWMNYGPTRQWDDISADETLRGIIEIGDYNGPADGQGNGLKGEYYNNIDFTALRLSRTDATVDFDWGDGSPDTSIGNNTFSVRWSGRIEPRYSERYTFQTTSDDGVRLWVNDRLIINKFVDQGPTAHTGEITLSAGQQYDIRMEYYDNQGGAVSQLEWSSASQVQEIVPQSQLYSDAIDSRTLASDSVLTGLRAPTAVDWLTDGSDRMLVAEQGGVVKLYENERLNATPFIDISRQVNGVRDRGLLDIAVHPDFANNPYVYLLFTYDPPEVFNYTGAAGPDGKNNRAARLIRVTADASNNYRTAVEGSEVVLLGTNSTWDNYNGLINSTSNIDAPPGGVAEDGSYIRDFLAADSESHTIGSVEFGPDGALYVSNGDGAAYNRVDPRAVRVQDLNSLSGKILRINPITGKGLSDNPFYNNDADANRSKVYQLGLRNPFRMTIDQGNGNIYIGDVGWTTWEEINAGEAGANFGWPYYEGETGVNARNNRYGTLPDADEFYNSDDFITPSILSLNHRTDGINAIIMGDVYTGDAYPERYKGDLFFGDLGQGIIRNVSFDSDGEVSSVETFDVEDSYVVQMAQGPDDLLYYVNQRNGTVKRWVFEA